MTIKKHILFLPKWYPNKIIPLNGNFIECHADAVSTINKVTVLFVRSSTNGNKKFEITDEKEGKVRVIRVFFKKPKGLFFWTYFLRYFKAQKIGFQLLIDENNIPDISHVHVLKRSAFFALFLKRKYQIPFLITEHWSGYTRESLRFKGWLNKIITRWIAARAFCITTVSNYLKQAMMDQGIKNAYHIVPNAVNTNNFNNTVTNLTDPPTLLHISTLEDSVKNVSGIIRTLSKLRADGMNFHMHILGDGKDKELQESMVKDFNLNSQVTFHGDIDRELVANYLKKSTALLIFSNYETQSVVMLEAMCCGIPVIGTNVGGIPEHLNAERGVLIPKKDEKALYEAIKSILNAEIKFDRQNIASYGKENFSMQQIGEMFDDIYQKMVQ